MMTSRFLLAAALSLTLGSAPFIGTASACEGGSADCACAHGKAKAEAAKTAKAETVALEGTVVSFGCKMEAARQGCTGAALVVGETKHLIRKAKQGPALVAKVKDSQKVVKVSGSKQGDYLTVDSFAIKG